MLLVQVRYKFKLNVSSRLNEIGEKLVAGGGRITDRLDDSALTHIIVGSNTSRSVFHM